MVPLNLQTTIDSELTALFSQLAIMQPAFFSIYGRYWQGKRTHTTPPSDGTRTAPDLNVRPTDQSETWNDLAITFPATTSAAYTVHAYQTRAGHGYVIHADVIISGVWHRKSLNLGPATWLTQTWRTYKVIQMS
jgi:hypothetical protein